MAAMPSAEKEESRKSLQALRLTSKRISTIAARQLFCRFYLSSAEASWFKLNAIMGKPEYAQHLRALTVGCCHHVPKSEREKNPITQIDLNLFPNLKSIECNNWSVVKGRNVDIPSQNCISLRIQQRYDGEDILIEFPRTLICGFDLQSLTLGLNTQRLQSHLVEADVSNLCHLVIHFDTRFSPDPAALHSQLLDLPHLVSFKLHQFSYTYDNSGIPHVTNLIRLLRGKRWPRLRTLAFSELVTTVADLKYFLLPHAGSLEKFFLHAQLVCAEETEAEREERKDLPNWISIHIAPLEQHFLI